MILISVLVFMILQIFIFHLPLTRIQTILTRPAPDSPDEKTDLGHFPSPDGICYMDGYIYVVEEQNNRVCGLTNFGDTFTVFGDNNGPFTLNKPGGEFFIFPALFALDNIKL